MTTTAPTTVPVARPGALRRGHEGLSRLRDASPLTYAGLVIAVIISVFPIYWMFVIATRSNEVVGQRPPPMLPGGNLGANLDRLLAADDAHFGLGLVNSLIVSTVTTASVVFFCSLAGFAFAKLRFRGANVGLLFVILTMMVPTQLGIIPLYILMAQLQWTGQLQAVIVPFLVTGFGVFMMRQYASQAVPDELIEAARVDGCSTFRVYWNVVLPALRPAMGVLALLTFMQNWNEFIWPLAVLNPDNPTVQYSINQLAAARFNDYSLMFTGSALATLPLLVVFIVFGRQIIGGIMEGAVKA